MNIQQLVIKACKLGAKGYRVLGWIPPQSGTDNPEGNFVVDKPEQSSPSEAAWYDR